MVDVAVHAGASRALVSVVFRDQPGAGEQTRAQILRSADELGYRPDNAARRLAHSRSGGVIGVVVTMHNLFRADLVDAIYPAAEEPGYDILLAATAPTRDEHQVVESLRSDTAAKA